MRRADRAVTDYNKMLAIVQDCDCCRLGLVDDGEAYIVPLNFGYRDEAGQLILYFHCAAEGRKVELFPRQKKVAFEMDVTRWMQRTPPVISPSATSASWAPAS